MFYQIENLGSGPTLVSILEWDAKAYFAAIAPAPGDANRDGRVDQDDAARLATYWGDTERADGLTWWQMGDFDNDHTVGPADAAILAANWGYLSPEATAMPEPSTLAMLIIVATACLAYRRRQH